MLFDWIRRSAKNAVLDGVNEAIAELSGAGKKHAVPELPEVCLSFPQAEVEVGGQPRKGRKVAS